MGRQGDGGWITNGQAPRLSLSVLGIALLLLAGCGQKLNYESTLQLEVGDVQAIAIDPPVKEQKVTVTVTSTASPVDVYLVFAKDKESGKRALLDRKPPAEPLAAKAKTTDAVLEATIPAGSGFVVLLGLANKSTSVKLKVSGQ